eukprot:COSAG03_NODE_24865_length_269_cov_0.900000_1_plen_34_part_01
MALSFVPFAITLFEPSVIAPALAPALSLARARAR